MHVGGRLHTERCAAAFLSSCRSKQLNHKRIPNSFQILNNFIMAKPCPEFQIKIHVGYWFIREFFHTERVVLPLWGGNFLTEQRCLQPALVLPLKRCRTHEIFHLKEQHNFTILGRTGRGKSGCPSWGISWQAFSIKRNVKFYSFVIWRNGWQARNFFFCFVKKSFCFQSRTTLERSLQADNTPIFEELYFHQIFFSVKS